MSSDLLTSFSPLDGTYQTKPTVIVVGSTTNENIPSTSSSNGRLSNKKTNSKPLIGSLIKNCKNNSLLSYILGATLLTSVFNTILLSLVIKSLQLNHKGFINGKISWDETFGGTVFQLPTSLRPDKSISLNSIESHRDKPLKFVSKSTSKDDEKMILMSTGLIEKKAIPSEPDHQMINPELSSSKSNYMAASEPGDDDDDDDADKVYHRKRLLEIGTKALEFHLINVNSLNEGHKNPSLAAAAANRLLFEFDDESRLIKLPLERELRQVADNSITLGLAGLVSDNIVGSHEESLRVQTTREGNLMINCRDSLELLSKSASVKVTTLDDLSLSSPSMTLSSNLGLYITNGIEYFDDSELAGKGAAAADYKAKGKNEDAEPEQEELIAYNLVVVDGILKATS